MASALKERFETSAGRTQAALDAIRRQKVLRDSAPLAQELLDLGVLRELAAGEELIREGGSDTDVFFVLMGRFDVRIKGNLVGERGADEMLGEIASLKPSNTRSATVVASEPSIVLQVSHEHIRVAAGDNVIFWRNVAEVMSERLDSRNRTLSAANDRPHVLIISSTEAIEVVRQIENNLGEDGAIAVEPWEKVFAISSYPISELKAAIQRADFVVAVMQGDDILISRSRKTKAPRDNVVLEYGMALGCLGPERSIMLVPTDVEVKLASDKDGLTYVGYREGDHQQSLRIACNKIRDHIRAYKVKG